MNIFKKRDHPHRWCISEIINSKKQFRSMSNNSRFIRGAFEKQDGKLAQTQLKSERQNSYHIYWSLRRQLSFKKSLLEICKMLRFFIKTLTTDDKYSLLNRDNLTQPIPTQLSQEQETFSQFFSPLLKYSFNSEHFEKKRSPS